MKEMMKTNIRRRNRTAKQETRIERTWRMNCKEISKTRTEVTKVNKKKTLNLK